MYKRLGTSREVGERWTDSKLSISQKVITGVPRIDAHSEEAEGKGCGGRK